MVVRMSNNIDQVFKTVFPPASVARDSLVRSEFCIALLGRPLVGDAGAEVAARQAVALSLDRLAAAVESAGQVRSTQAREELESAAKSARKACAGRKQRQLKLAGCTVAEISRWCAAGEPEPPE